MGGWEGLAIRYEVYRTAAAVVDILKSPHDTARIVEAPAREMTDAEAWVWFRGHDMHCLSPASDAWGVYEIPKLVWIASGLTPEDAIRAARRALEAKR